MLALWCKSSYYQWKRSVHRRQFQRSSYRRLSRVWYTPERVSYALSNGGHLVNSLPLSFFSSYRVAWGGWIYIFGDFAQQSLPLSDSVTLKVQRVNHTGSEDVVVSIHQTFYEINLTYCGKLPYRSKSAIRFSSTAAWRNGHCINQGSQSRSSSSSASRTPLLNTRRTGQAPTLVAEKPLVNVIRENALILDMSLPSALVPRIKPITASRHAAEFYMLGNNKTGVLALGSFEDEMRPLMRTFLEGLRALKVLGATQLIIDVVSSLESHHTW